MSFDLADLGAAIAAHGRVARVVIAEVSGSAPREVGAAMLVWQTPEGFGQSGTIGGGALELMAAERAFSHQGLSRHPLGPSLGQCCGGSVTLLTEQYDALPEPEHDVIVRGPGDMPMVVKRALAAARGQGQPITPQLIAGWMVEPIVVPSYPIWIYGAGHVGRALVSVLSPLPELDITWVDTGPDRFPTDIPPNVTQLVAADPALAAAHAPAPAHHLILTYSHALDLELCHAILRRPFASCGLIGSASKWARFRNRLASLGHSDAQIARICCPIGQKSLGKHPHSIAIGVAADLLSSLRDSAATVDIAI